MYTDRDRAGWSFEAASAAERAGDIEGAIDTLAHAVALDPSRASWHHRLGVLRGRRRDWIGAVAAFTAAAELDRRRSSRFMRLGRARERAWDLAGATEAYATAVTMAAGRETWAEVLCRSRRSAEQFHPFRGVIVAHRGSWRGMPENALESLVHLPMAVTGVEVDVRMSGDGVAQLMHDGRVDRTTDGSGMVECMASAELKALRGAGGVRVPTLEEYLTACTGRALQTILVDVKSTTLEALSVVAHTVGTSPVAGACVVMVRTADDMRQLRMLDSDLRLGSFGVTLANVEERVAAALTYRAELLLIAHGDRRYLRNRSVIEEVRRAGLRAGASTVNTRAAIEAARVDCCDLLVTDQGDQLDHFAAAEAIDQG